MAFDTLFREKAPSIMRLLMADFGITTEDAAAVLGNLGHESGGFKFIQEKKPLVKGSRGGYGWAQWTGPRRRAFEAYCARNDLEPASDKANYGFLFVELTGPEKKAIPAVKKATTLRAKVEAFERAFERAGVKHYESREAWAKRALEAWSIADMAAKLAPQSPAPAPEPPPAAPQPPVLVGVPVPGGEAPATKVSVNKLLAVLGTAAAAGATALWALVTNWQGG